MDEPSDLMLIAGISILVAIVGIWAVIAGSLFKGVGPTSNTPKSALILVLFTGLALSACTTINPGHVGIRVNSYGANRGVEDYPAVTGFVTYNPISTSVIEYPVFVQNVSWTKDVTEGHPANEEISFNTGDQMVVYADISLAYQLEQTKAPAFYVKFRADDIDKWTHGFLRNLTRQKFDEVAGKYKIEQIMGDNAPFLKEVHDAVQNELDPYGVKLDQLGFIGSPRPPQAVIDSINGKVKATQDAIRVENEVRQTKAQAEKNVAQAEGEAAAAIAKANGEAKANTVVNSSITTNLLEWRRLDISSMATNKWNGALPTYSGGTMPFIQLPTK
jgi:regulator of protease activity HflC (stomatin/prohibitin superfamily)